MDTLSHYKKIAAFLAGQIEDGRYPVGAKLPTERELCETFGVSRHTAREALRYIDHLGLITRRQGSGSTVIATTPPVRHEQSVQSIDDLMHHSSVTRLQVIKCVEIQPHENQFSSQIALVAKAGCIRIHAIRYPHHEVRPLSVLDLYVAVQSTAQAKRLLNLETAAREVVATCDPRRLSCIEQTFKAVNLSPTNAKLLHVKAGDAAFQTVRRYFDLNSRLVAVSHSLYEGQQFTYASTLHSNVGISTGKVGP